MIRWFLIYSVLILIQDPVNNFRFVEHDNADAKGVIKEGEGKSQKSVLSPQEELVHFGSPQTGQDLPHLEQSSFQGRQLLADYHCSHVRDRSVALQVVYASQQGESLEMWAVRLSVASIPPTYTEAESNRNGIGPMWARTRTMAPSVRPGSLRHRHTAHGESKQPNHAERRNRIKKLLWLRP